MTDVLSELLILVFGVVIFISGILDLDFIHSGAKGEFLNKILKPFGTRLFHILIGLFAAIVAILALFNFIELN